MGLHPVPRAEPSPKFHVHEYGVVPPLIVAVKVTGLPTIGDAGLEVKEAVRASGFIVIVAGVADARPGVGVAESVTLTWTVKDPFTVYVCAKTFGLVLPLARLPDPSPKFQVKLNGAVPPDAVAVQLTGVPTVPVDGQESVTATTPPTCWVMESVAPLWSVTFSLTVKVPLAA